MATDHDPVTFRHLEDIGVCEGWSCAEVGGGNGSVAVWLADRVGPAGHILATDRDIRCMDSLGPANLEVREEDICAVPLEPDAFDLVHARLVLMHTSDRELALGHLVGGLRPGGWLLVEEPDFSVSRYMHPSSPSVERVIQLVIGLFECAGADVYFGRALPTAMRGAGLVDVIATGELSVVQFGTKAAESLALLFEDVGGRLVGQDLLAEHELSEAIDIVRTPSETTVYSPLIISTTGRRPTSVHAQTELNL